MASQSHARVLSLVGRDSPLAADLAAGRLATSVETAAKVLGISRGLGYEAARRGELPGVLRVGNRFLVSIPALLASLGLDMDPAS